MPILLISSWELPGVRGLAKAAEARGWPTRVFDESPDIKPNEKVIFYGGTDKARLISKQFHVALMEPPFDLLPRLPAEFRLRSVEYARFSELGRLKAPTFVKPADALDKFFDAGVYSSVRDIRVVRTKHESKPVIVAEPVEWSAEFRCFILDGKVVAWSPYVSFGRPSWKQFELGAMSPPVPANITAFCERLFSRSDVSFPPAFVMDIGRIEERGWAVVEFNPAWCSGLLGADPQRVLAVLNRACQNECGLNTSDRRWRVERAGSTG
jgi:ATP-grasp domain, R2K clade family 3